MSTLETTQNYLEAIYVISLKNPHVRAIDVCEYFDFKRPTVSVAIKKLAEEGYLTVTNNIISLTKKGLKEALKTYERHETLAHIFMSLGIDRETAYRDACLVEHDLSDVTFEAIKNYYDKRIKSSDSN